jgi:hypothetical protein
MKKNTEQNKKIQAIKLFQSFSLRNQRKKKILFITKSARKLEPDSFKIKQVRCWKRKTWKSFGIY